MRPNTRRPPGIPHSALADTLMDRLTAAYAAAADPGQAAPMAAYMKEVAPFPGIRTPLRRQLSRAVTKDTPRPSETDCAALALRCRGLAEREYQYFAADPDAVRAFVASERALLSPLSVREALKYL